jgi:hypothetical protein
MIAERPGRHGLIPRRGRAEDDRMPRRDPRRGETRKGLPVEWKSHHDEGQEKGVGAMSALSICACGALTVGYLLLAVVEIFRVFGH